MFATKARLLPEQWLLIERPANDAEPLKHYLPPLSEDISLNELMDQAHMRWRIERDYQDLNQELGLGDYKGRGWRGFHHHVTLSIAKYGFVVKGLSHCYGAIVAGYELLPTKYS